MVDDFGVPKLKKSHSFLNQWQYQNRDIDFASTNQEKTGHP